MDKLEYITRQISRARKKRYEHYVVTRIWHLLNDLSIKFVTQQYVKGLEGRALTDMFFPQLKIHIEVDEGFHKNQIVWDKLRQADIVNATGHEVFRVDVTNDINIVNQEIDDIIKKLIDKKNGLSDFKPWDLEAEINPQTYINKGFIDLSDDCAFRTMVDAANCFGNNYKPKGVWSGGAKHPKELDKIIWFPKLYRNEKWNNSISDDEKTITEISAEPDKIKPHIDSVISSKIYYRVVFARVKSPLGDIMYRFRGLYKFNLKDSNYDNGLIWERTLERVPTYSH
jgi:very-short-patch-repair endonuclease